MYALIGKFTATAGNQAALAKQLLSAAAAMENVPGCLQYLVYQDDTNGVWVSELWTTKEDHDASLQLPGIPELIAQTRPLIAGTESFPIRLVGGHGPRG
jgi:quinol monooxygenase YgiN